MLHKRLVFDLPTSYCIWQFSNFSWFSFSDPLFFVSKHWLYNYIIQYYALCSIFIHKSPRKGFPRSQYAFKGWLHKTANIISVCSIGAVWVGGKYIMIKSYISCLYSSSMVGYYETHFDRTTLWVYQVLSDWCHGCDDWLLHLIL